MQHSRRVFLGAAISSIGGMVVGCGGGSKNEDNLSASGRFVRQDVTPRELLSPEAGISGFQLRTVSASGVIGVTLFQSQPQVGHVPAVIDIDKRSVTRLRYEGADVSEPLLYGAPMATNAQGDVYGAFKLAKDAASVFNTSNYAYHFAYSRATGKMTVFPFTSLGHGGVSNAGDTLVDDVNGTAIMNLNGPQTNKKFFYFDGIGDSQGYSINAKGTVVGGFQARSLSGPTFLFLRKDDVVTRLSGFRRILDLTDDDRVVGMTYDAQLNGHIVIWQNGELTPLPDPPVTIGYAVVAGTNTRGEILFAISEPEPADKKLSHFLLWRSSTGTWLDLTADVRAIHPDAAGLWPLADGRIVMATATKIYTLTPR